MELSDASPDEGKKLIVTVRLTPRDYKRLKEAFEQGQLEQFGVRDVYQFLSAEPAGSEQKGFAKAEEHKRMTHKKSDSPHDLP